ncbi:MAG: hypothetical protein QOG30_530, partial [Acidimicrobiaceae bacterium]
MTTRLITLVMLPVTAMCLFAGSVVLSHRSSAADAMAVERSATGLNDLVALRAGLQVQQMVEAFDVRFAELGVTRAVATAFLGVDWSSEVAAERSETRQKLASLGPRSPFSATALQLVYTEIDLGVLGPGTAAQRLATFVKQTDVALTHELDRLEAQARNTPLVGALESLRKVNGLLDLAAPEAVDLSSVWFPAATDTAQSTAAVLARLATERTGYVAIVTRLRELNVESVVAGIARIETDPDVRTFDQAVQDTLLGLPLTEVGAELDLDKAAATFRGFFARDALLDELVTTSTTAVRDEARRVAAAERASYITWTLGAAALALASIGVALWLARSISKPLKDLASYAHAVNEGLLDAEPSARHSRGPRETRVAFGIFTDMVANLQLLDAKANALAHCDFDDPVLHVPLPGRLGRSLESSVALLSGSIVERDQLQTHLAHEATHDSLTGISNRPAAITAIEAAMHRAARTGATTAV